MTGASSASGPAASASNSPPASKTRNPVERLIVWGLILLGIALIAVEAVARISYSQSLARLQEAIEAAESSFPDSGTSTLAVAPQFVIEQVPALMVGNPTQTNEDRGTNGVTHFRWHGFLKQYGLHVHYRQRTRLVTGFETDDPPPEAPAPARPVATHGAADAPAAASSGAPDMAGPAGRGPGGDPAGGGGPGGGRGGFDPLQADADGDGRLSRDEAPERLREFFDRIDTNSDGYLDAAELAARRNRGGGGRSGGPGGGEGTGPSGGPGGRDAADRSGAERPERSQRPPLDRPALDRPAEPETPPAPNDKDAPAPDAAASPSAAPTADPIAPPSAETPQGSPDAATP